MPIPIGGLTPAELCVLELLAAGYTNLEISQRLICSAETVKSHVHHILEKLEAPNRREAGRIWREKITRNGG